MQFNWPLGLNRVEIEKDSLLLIDDSNPNGSSQILFNPSGNLEYSQDVGETLRNNLSAEQQEIMTDLENEKVRGDETKTEEIETALAEVQNKPISSKSTIYRALEEAGYNAGLSDRAIQPKNIIVPGYKNKDKKEE